jgi:hypothetical protein
MKVRCVANSGDRLPDLYLDPAGGYTNTTRFELTKNKVYVVYAITLRRGGVWYYVLDESGVGYPVWIPAPLFEITDARISQYWTFGFADAGLRDGSALFAFAEWARDPADFYDRLTDGESSAVDVFGKYRELMELEFQESPGASVAEDMGDGWMLCPNCRTSWRSPARGESLRCPHCKAILRNPALATT